MRFRICRGRATPGATSPEWLDSDALMSILRSLPDGTTVERLSAEFSVRRNSFRHDDRLVSDLAQDPEVAAGLLTELRDVAIRTPRLIALGEEAADGEYAVRRGNVEIDGCTLPAIVEVWSTSTPAKATDASVHVRAPWINRTVALTRASGHWASRRVSLSIGGGKYYAGHFGRVSAQQAGTCKSA